jgi:hypothetical protein
MFEVEFIRSGEVQARAFDIEDIEDVAFVAETLWQDDVREYPIQSAEKSRSVRVLLDGEPLLLWNTRPSFGG